VEVNVKTEVKEGDQPQPPEPKVITPPKVSPVYSLEVESEGVWALAGTEVSLLFAPQLIWEIFTWTFTQSGNINLYTVRHDEGYVRWSQDDLFHI
jgi:hypothetical protein